MFDSFEKKINLNTLMILVCKYHKTVRGLTALDKHISVHAIHYDFLFRKGWFNNTVLYM